MIQMTDRQKSITNLHPNVDITQATTQPGHHFFGFYDTSPWDGGERYLLAIRTSFCDRVPSPEDPAEICLIDTENGYSSQSIATSTAWNFQQGCRLQWIGPHFNKRFAFNDRENGNLVGRIYHLTTGEEQILERPIFTIDPDGDKAVTMDFNRGRGGYGYSDTTESSAPSLGLTDDDGLYLIDLATSKSELIISFSELGAIEYRETMNSGQHWIDHIRFSPSGSRLAFLHRWTLPDGGMYTRLLTCRPNGTDIKCVIDSGRVTHFDWYTSDQIIAWSRHQETINKITKDEDFQNPIQSVFLSVARAIVTRISLPTWLNQNIMGEGYYLYDVPSGERQRIGERSLHMDGHPSVSPNQNWILTDTYPDNNSQRHLWLYNMNNKERVDIGKFHSPKEYNNTVLRCDLHPRWNRTGSKVCIDSFHEGIRQIYTIDISRIVNK